jgi:D-glycero-beta-D-manno-heptose-7-phosphate kinase
MHTFSDERITEILRGIQGKHIAVVGDIMLDRYFWGSVYRISPEAPVPVVDVESESSHLGGASNVAANLQSLGAVPLMLGVIGDDNSGNTIRDLLRQSEMSCDGIVIDFSRPTTVKTRIIGNNQQIARLDRERKTPADESVVRKLLAVMESAPNLAAIVLEDYNKGVITSYLIKRVTEIATQRGIPVFVDPKFTNFFAYEGVTLFKPNKKETQDALGITLSTDEDILSAGETLLERLKCENVLLTLGARGMMLFEKSGAVHTVDTRARHVADVSGAGDTAIATLTAAFAAGASIVEASALANVAAGAVCEVPGIVAITPERLRENLREDALE